MALAAARPPRRRSPSTRAATRGGRATTPTRPPPTSPNRRLRTIRKTRKRTPPASEVRRGPRTAEEVREAFRKKRRSTEPERDKAVFDEYFSAESLFTTVGGEIDGEVFDRDDPYVVLGVAGSATWEQITLAHRRLAKLHHPDRLLHATAADREKSESRMREINVAYSELRRRRGKIEDSLQSSDGGDLPDVIDQLEGGELADLDRLDGLHR